MHDDDRRGFNTFKTVVRRLKERDPNGEYSCWRKCSEITNYACAAELSELTVTGNKVVLDLPVRVPEFTLRITDVDVKGVSVDGRPLQEAGSRRAFASDTFYRDGGVTLAAFEPTQRSTTVEVTT